jgi:phospholipid/cholesterol/gamma-HCH transport system substrate-binding protein
MTPNPPALPSGPPTLARPLDAQRIQRRAWAVLALVPLILAVALAYMAYAQGWFTRYVRYDLVASEAKGISPRTPVTFAGLPIGEVEALAVQADGRVQVTVRIAEHDARWVQADSLFTLERPLVGAVSIRLVPGGAQPVPAGQPRPLGGQAQELDVAQMGDRVNRILGQVEAALAPDSPLQRSLGQVATLLERSNGRYGLLQAVAGSEAQAAQWWAMIQGLDATNRQASALLAQSRAVLARVDAGVNGGITGGTTGGADGPAAGLVGDLRATVAQTQALLASLVPVVQSVQSSADSAAGVVKNVQGATVDLNQLRTDVERNLRQLDDISRQLQQRWPLAVDRQIELP